MIDCYFDCNCHKLICLHLENIDDECDQHGIAFVKIDDIEVSKRFGIEYEELPTLVYFEEKIPNFYQGKKNLFSQTMSLT